MTWANICHHESNVGFCQHKSCLIACQMTNKNRLIVKRNNEDNQACMFNNTTQYTMHLELYCNIKLISDNVYRGKL